MKSKAIRPALALALVVGMGALLFASLVVPSAHAELELKTLQKLQNERRALAKALTPSVVAVAAQRPDFGPGQTGMAGATSKAASGFVVDGDYVVTNIESGQLGRDVAIGNSVWLFDHQGTEFGGKVVGTDQRNLLVLIKMDDKHPDLPSLKLADSDKVKMGQTAVMVGNTLDSMLVDGVTSFSYGMVSGFYRFEPVDVLKPNDTDTGGDPYKGNVLETDCAIHDGDHGSPLVNLDGEVIGMTCAHYMAGRHMGCAVPSNQIRAVLAQLKKGVAQDDLAQAELGFGVRKPEGEKSIYIKSVTKDGPAAKAGIPVGWELLRVDNYRIPRFDRLKEMLGVGYIERNRVIRSAFGQRSMTVPVSYGVPVGTHIQLTLRNPDTGEEKTFDLITGQKEEDF